MSQLSRSRRVEAMAIGWGGLFAAIGLLLAATWAPISRGIVVAVAFVVGGFLAAVRAEDLRTIHAALAAVAAFAFHAVFVLLGNLVALVGGPDAPHFVPGSDRDWGIVAIVGLVAAIVGGLLASSWLRPQRGRRRRVPS